jgi:tRNA:m4X modification enzyme
LEPIRESVGACVLATCCHGICDWKEYVGRDYLRQEMEDGSLRFGPAEFDLLRRWCAGSVACQNTSTDENASSDNAEAATQDASTDDLEHASGGPMQADTKPESINDNVNISAIVHSLKLCCGIPGLGRACQRLIDHGRSEYLCKRIFCNQESACVDLCHYVHAEVTPQNAVLIARYR